MNVDKVNNFLKNNTLTILALLISVFTLIMYIRQTNLLTRQTNILIEQNKATTWPYLYIGRSIAHVKDSAANQYSVSYYNISITNQGNGPAVIEKAVLRLDGIEMETWDDLYRYTQVPEHISRRSDNSTLRNTVIMPGGRIVLINWSDNLPLLNHIYAKFDSLELEICYRSVLNEYWTVKRSSFDELSYYEKDIMTHLEGCQINTSKYFKE